MSDKVGQQIGNYRLVRLLGSGGFAEVYLAQHVHIHLQVAIKILHAQLGQNYQEGFLQEAETLAHLKHPHIIRILDFGITSGDNAPYLIIEYAPDGTLRTRHPRGSIVPPGTVFVYVKQIASALQYAHDHNLVHRDLKPENLLVGDEGEILLSDFGIAAIAHGTSSMETSAYAGTVPYSAPEQIQGKPRRESDQYSLGIIVYEWLTGERPFLGTFQEVISQHLGVFPHPLHEKLPTIPPAVEAVIMKALAKEPKQRFGSIQDFATAFEQACHLPSTPVVSAVQPISSQNLHPQTAVVGLRITRRNVLLLGLVGAGLTATGIVGWLELAHRSPANSGVPEPVPVGTTLYTYHGHADKVISVTWSPDGKRIASTSSDKTVQVWDAADGGLLFTYRGHNWFVNAVAWSPDSKLIASAGNGTVQVWDAVDGSHSYTYHGQAYGVFSVAWSPDGKRIASGGRVGSVDNTVQMWDAADGNPVYTYRGHTDLVGSVAWSPDSKRIASASSDQTVQVWQAM